MVDQLTKDRKNNLKIYSLYRSFSLDFIFYYVIEFLFLTQVKGLAESYVVLSYSFYAIFKIIFQIPINHLINVIGSKKSILIGCTLNLFFIVNVMLCKNVYMLILSSFLSSVAFSFKDVADLSLLKSSIPESRQQGNIYAKMEESGYKNYFYINAVASMCAGSLYVVNPYYPLIGAFTFLAISLFIALGFKDIKSGNGYEKHNKKSYFKEMKKQTKFILKSPRLRCLNVAIGVISGIFSLLITYRASLLVDIDVEEEYITMIIAIIGIFCAFGSAQQKFFLKKYKNISLAVIMIVTTVMLVSLGLCANILKSSIISIILIIVMLVVTGFMEGIFKVISNKFLSHFTNDNLLPQVLSMKETIRYVCVAVIDLMGSILLKYTNVANALVVIGCVLFVFSLFWIIYMKTRVGLEPEEYGKEDIYDRSYIK